MPKEFLEILLSALGVIITGLVGWGVSALTSWLNSKIKDQKAAGYLNTITTLTGNAVREVYQTYVEVLKKEGKFDGEAQKKALEKCLERIKKELAPDMIDFITKNFGDMSEYLKGLIESTIYSLKH